MMAGSNASKANSGGKADLVLLALFKRMSLKMFGDFQSERLTVQVGETLGRELASGSDIEGLPKAIAGYIQERGLGSVRFEAKQKGERYEALGVFHVIGSVETQEDAKKNSPCCSLLRSIIRGAFVGLYHQENIAVRETKCAAAGADECEFEAYWVPM